MYPTTIIVLVALKQSPIDNGGLSQVRQAHGHSRMAEARGTPSTIAFHHPSSHTSTGVETESAMEGLPAGDHGTTHESLDTLMSEGEMKVRASSTGSLV